MSEHSPTPWASKDIGYGSIIVAANKSEPAWVGDASDADSAANAAHIVKCVNAHDELVAMVKKLELVKDGDGRSWCPCCNKISSFLTGVDVVEHDSACPLATLLKKVTP